MGWMSYVAISLQQVGQGNEPAYTPRPGNAQNKTLVTEDGQPRRLLLTQPSDGCELTNPAAYPAGQGDEQVREKVLDEANCVELELTTRPRTCPSIGSPQRAGPSQGKVEHSMDLCRDLRELTPEE